MKIAIKANPNRGKEIISLLESLGGNNIRWEGDARKKVYYIDKHNVIQYGDAPKDYKVYTLEEFEKEFPFKIGDEVIFPVINGWVSGKVTGIKDFEYEVDTKGGYRYVEPHKLSLYPMKEERNITLTLEKAKEWYNKGGELKEIALQAFTEKELNPLPRSWEEFCNKYPIKEGESYINSEGKILSFITETARRDWNHICPSKQSAEAHIALIQLEQLRDCYNNSCNDTNRIAIINNNGNIELYVNPPFNCFLTFKNHLLAREFFSNFKEIIEIAKKLI